MISVARSYVEAALRKFGEKGCLYVTVRCEAYGMGYKGFPCFLFPPGFYPYIPQISI